MRMTGKKLVKRERHRRKSGLFTVCLLAVGILLLQGIVIQFGMLGEWKQKEPEEQDEAFRGMELSEDVLQKVAKGSEKAYLDAVCELCQSEEEAGRLAAYTFCLAKRENQLAKMICKRILSMEPETERYQKAYKTLLKDIEVFPVKRPSAKEYWVSYEDSWGNARTYGGKRRHEGCDLMAENNERGYFEIVSVSEGVVEKKGWLEQGGYRIGIRSPSGAYYYYAHLADYAPIEVGDYVEAGTVLGHMGDTGYSKVEGTTGNFDVHLHFGMYLDLDGKETAVNPYYVLRYLEKKTGK